MFNEMGEKGKAFIKLSPYYVPGPLLSALYILVHSVLTITIQGNCCYPHFRVEEVEGDRK